MKPRNVLKSLALLWFGAFGGAGIGFVTQVLVARALAATGYGAFASAVGIVTIAAPFAGFGLQGLLLRVHSQEGVGAARWMHAAKLYVTATAVLCVTGVLGLALLSGDRSSQLVLVLLVPTVLAQMITDLASAKFMLNERHALVTIVNLSPHVLRIASFLLIAALGEVTPTRMAAAYGAAALITVASWGPAVRTMFSGRFLVSARRDLSRQVLGGISAATGAPSRVSLHALILDALPFGAAAVFFFVHMQSAVVLLNVISGPEEAGMLSVAATLLSAAYILPNTAFQRFLLPLVHRWSVGDRRRLLWLYRAANAATLLGGLCVALILSALAPWLIRRLYGAGFEAAIDVIQVISLCIPVRYLATSVGAVLVTNDRMWRKTRDMGVVAIANVVLTLGLAPSLGAVGAAAAALASESLLLVLYLTAVRRHVFGSETLRGWSTKLLFESGGMV